MELENRSISLPDPVDHMEYRGFTVDFYEDPYGQQVYTVWNGEKLGFGTYNTMYKDDMEYVIDDYLDTVTRFKDRKLPGSKLTWFDNDGHRDLKVTYRGRILKVWLVDNPAAVNIDLIISEAASIIYKIREVEKK